MGVVVVKPEDVRTFGANAALLLAQINYWLKRPHARCVREEDGEIWCGQARAEWQLQCGLSGQQLRTAIEHLCRAGVLVRKRHLHENRVTAFFRIDRVEYDRVGMGEETQTDLGVSNQNDLGRGTRIYKDEDCIETDKRIGVVSTHLSPGEIKEIVLGEEKTMARKPMSVIGGSVKEMTGGKQAVAPVSLVDVSKPGHLGTVFTKAWAESYEDFLPSFTSRQLGQLGHLIKRCPRGEVGYIVDWAVRNWPVFVSAAVAREGAFGTPQLPTVDFLLRFVQTAVNCWQEARLGGKPPAEHKSKQPKPKFVPPVPEKIQEVGEKPATLEEVAKLLGKKL